MKQSAKELSSFGVQTTVALGANAVLPASMAPRVAVLARGTQGLCLEDQREIKLKVALSCLVEPLEGDRVLVFQAGDECFILAVLERHWQERRMTIDLGNREVQVRAAEIRLDADRDLEFNAENLRSNAELAVHRCATQITHVTGASVLNASSVAMEAQQSLCMQTKLGVIQASTLLKVDGTQMHFG